MDLFNQMKDTHHIRAVQNRLNSLIQQNVISSEGVSFDEVTLGEQRLPRILVTLDRLTEQKRFSGLEQSVKRVAELIVEGKTFECRMAKQ